MESKNNGMKHGLHGIHSNMSLDMTLENTTNVFQCQFKRRHKAIVGALVEKNIV